MKQARYIMVGGFLGAGKTTAILKMARLLRSRGQSVGLITNDQSFGLVDTAMLASHGFPVQEITGGCFCCKFNSLVEASRRLSAEAAPDTFIAEPVGSCTDLKATVDYPLRRLYGGNYRIAPLSVLVDPLRAARILGLERGSTFSARVLYVYQKQLEEAEIIVVNKSDLVPPDRLARLTEALASRFAQARVWTMSARTGEGLEAWVDQIASMEPRTDGAMEVDYRAYAEGEALLGWLNATLRVAAPPGSTLDGNALLISLAKLLQSRLRMEGGQIAHLKMVLSPGGLANDIAVANLVRSDGEPELSHRLVESIAAGELIVNLRAEADPEALRSAALGALELMRADNVVADVEHMEHFRPAEPRPTHRLAAV